MTSLRERAIAARQQAVEDARKLAEIRRQEILDADTARLRLAMRNVLDLDDGEYLVVITPGHSGDVVEAQCEGMRFMATDSRRQFDGQWITDESSPDLHLVSECPRCGFDSYDSVRSISDLGHALTEKQLVGHVSCPRVDE